MMSKNNLNRFISFVYKNNRKKFLLSILLVFIVTITDLVLPLFTKNIIDNGIIGKNIEGLFLFLSMFIIFSTVSILVDICLKYLYSFMRNNVGIKLRLRILNHISFLSGSYYTDKKTGDLLSIIQSDVDVVENLDAELIFSIVKNTMIAFMAIIFMIRMDKELFMMVLIFQIIIILVQKYFSSKIYDIMDSIRKHYGESMNIAQEYVLNIMNIIISKYKRKFISKYIKIYRNIIDKSIKTDLLISSNISIAMIVNLIVTAIIYGYGGYKIINNTFTIGSLIAFQTYCGMLTGPCMSIINANNYIQKAKVSIDRIYSVLDEKPEIVVDNSAKKFKKNEIRRVEFKNVFFSYFKNNSNTELNYVLNNISIVLEKGKKYALVGGSGCGKSTLINLIYRFWDVNSGTISVNDYVIDKINLMSLRKNISIITQDIVIFDGTIKDNIAISRFINESELINLCEDIGLGELINYLENGIHTQLGERGIKISGGQKQRISIARAILNDSDVIIFDEATSALDNITQNNIFSRLSKYLDNKIVIMIAHRLSTIKDADEIYVMNEGKIVEYGSHNELININGLYKKIYEENSKTS